MECLGLRNSARLSDSTYDSFKILAFILVTLRDRVKKIEIVE